MSGPDSGSLVIEFTVSHANPAVNLPRVERLLRHAAAQEAISGEVGVWLCDDEEIADLHQRFMGISGPTDVITFSGEADGSGGYLGDIAVSIDTARVQAADAGHGPGREVAFLCLHGLLHLAGYDDLDDEMRRLMLRRQEVLLNEFEREHPGTWDESANH